MQLQTGPQWSPSWEGCLRTLHVLHIFGVNGGITAESAFFMQQYYLKGVTFALNLQKKLKFNESKILCET